MSRREAKPPKVLQMRMQAQGTQRPFLVSRLPGKADGCDTTLARVIARDEQAKRSLRPLSGNPRIAFAPDRN